MRTILRRNLQDVPEVQWANDELNELLNVGYSMVQKEIRKWVPNAHQYWDYINTVAGTNWYPLPNTFGIRRVNLKNATTNTYDKLTLKDYDDIKDQTGLDYYYAKEGQWIGIFPAPLTMTNGIELVHVPIMAMATDDEVPRIKTPLHPGIVWWAKLIAKGETAEQDGSEQARLRELISDIPTWYDVTTDVPEVIGIKGI